MSTRKKKGKVKRAARAVAAHVQLANAVLRGEFRQPCVWQILKMMYFKKESDAACDRALAKWADRHGIEYEKRPVRSTAPGTDVQTFEVLFRRKSL